MQLPVKSLPLLCALLLVLAACGPSDEELIANYQQAYQLARDGVCDEAMPLFATISESDTEATLPREDRSLKSLASTGRGACSSLARAADTMDSDPADALASLGRALPFFRDSSQSDVIKEMIATLWGSNSVAGLAQRDTCQNWRVLADHFPNPDNNTPNFLLACGDQKAEQTPGSTEARDYYRNIVQRYGGSEYSDTAKAALAEQTSVYVANEPDQFLFFAQPDGIEDSGVAIGGDRAIVSIANGTSDPINLVLNGPEVVVETVERCEDCGNSAECSGSEPFVDIELPAGTYQIVLESGGIQNQLALMTGFADINPGVKPYAGEWELTSGTYYPLCFFIETSE